MNNPPLTHRELEVFLTSKPTVRYSDDAQKYRGVASEFLLEERGLTITFTWISIGGRLHSDHRAIFPDPRVVSNENDILVVRHAGGKDVFITNLASHKFAALQEKGRIEKEFHH